MYIFYQISCIFSFFSSISWYGFIIFEFFIISAVKFAPTVHIQSKYIQNQVLYYFEKSIDNLDLFWADKTSDFHTKYYGWYSVWCCSCYYYYTISLSKAWTLVLQRFKPCSRRVGDCQWLESQTMVSAGNKTTRLSSVNHTTRVIHH